MKDVWITEKGLYAKETQIHAGLDACIEGGKHEALTVQCSVQPVDGAISVYNVSERVIFVKCVKYTLRRISKCTH